MSNNIQAALIMHLDCAPEEVKELIVNLCAIPSAQWDWVTCSHWLWFGVAGDDSPEEINRVYVDDKMALLRLRLTLVVAARVDCWRDLDAQLGFSYDTIRANAKPGVDLLIRAAQFDPDWVVRLSALNALAELGDLEGIAALAYAPSGYESSSLELTSRLSMARVITHGIQN